MGLRYFSPSVTSCPGCGRTSSDYFQYLARDINDHIKRNMPRWKKKYEGVEKLKIAVMGCVVNGPGESRHADIGISLPGTSEKPIAPVLLQGIVPFVFQPPAKAALAKAQFQEAAWLPSERIYR